MSVNFTVTQKGFTDPNGRAWSARGVNVDRWDALQNLQGIQQNYPGVTMVRVVCLGGSDTLADIDPIVQAYTSKGIVVELEDHADSQGGDNTGWYTMLANAYKSNPLVFLETPNEPNAPNTAQNQIDIIKAIRATGFANPIGIQPIGGWDRVNIPQVVAQVGTTNLYMTPHVYYNGTDPNGAKAFVQGEIQGGLENGLYSVIDEFGNALDGYTMDPLGDSDIQAAIAANMAGQAGAVFWAAGNGYHPDGADSAFLNQAGTQLTSTGKEIQGWLSQPFISPIPGGQPPEQPQEPPTPSPDNTVILANKAGASIVDANHNVWTIVNGSVFENGSAAGYSSGVTELAYEKGVIWQENSSSLWWSWNGTGWDGGAGIATSPVPPPPVLPAVSTGSGSDTLVLSICEDAYANGDKASDAAGDANFTVSVDGKQLAGIFTAKASHTAGVDQTFTFKGDWAPGSHLVSVNFLNDAWGGTASTDRNLYVDKVTYDGTNLNRSMTFGTSGAQSFGVTDNTALPPPVTGAGADKLVVKVSEDYYLGDAKFTVAVDGKQLGGTFTATTLHSSGGSQAFAFAGDFGAGQHSVSVKFLNDAYAGTPATDRNLYVNDIVYNGVDTKATSTLYSAVSRAFTVNGGTTPSVTETSDHGSLQKNLSQTGTYQVGGDTIVLSSGNAASVTLGTGASKLTFVGPSSLRLTGGSGTATITADTGANTFTAGAGKLDVTGGGGNDTYVFHANSGLLTIEDFSVAKGDKLTIDSAMKGSMVQSSDGQGGTLITFGSAGHAIDVHGVAAVPASSITWS